MVSPKILDNSLKFIGYSSLCGLLIKDKIAGAIWFSIRIEVALRLAAQVAATYVAL
jgi:hypothetical protein